MRKSGLYGAVAAVALLSCGAAHAGVVSLNFEGVNPTYPNTPPYTAIENFYNGGTSAAGTSGVNYGVTFSSNADALCLNSLTVTCSNSSRGGIAPGSSEGSLIFFNGASAAMDDAAGFQTGFSFNYSLPYAFLAGTASVQVFSGLDGSGSLLASLVLPVTPDGRTGACSTGYSADFCPFEPDGLAFAGTAESIEFSGVANFVEFDDVTFGSTTPVTNGVPEPASLALVGAGLAGLAGLRRRRKKAA